MPNKVEFNGFDDDIFDPEDFEEETPDTEEEIQDDESETDDNVELVETVEETSETTKEPDEQVKTQEEAEVETKKPETDKNSYYAQKRREREAAEKAQREKEIREAAKLEAELGLIKKNPYTNEVISDEEDLKIYKLQKAIEENGGDPITDLPKALAEQNRKEAKERKALAEQNQATQEKLAKEANELFEKYPEAVNVAQNDQELLDLMAEKDGRWTMVECYEHLAQKRKYEQSVKKKTQDEQKKKEVVEETTNKYHKIPSAQPNGGKVSEDDYSTMTTEEYIKSEEAKKIDFF